MFEAIWRAIQRKFTGMAVRKQARRSTSPEIELLSAWENVRRVLIFWPGSGMDVLAARVVFNRVRDRFPHAGLTVLALPGIGASPPSEVDAEVISVHWNELTFFGVPGKKLRDRLHDGGYDAVVDLSPRFEPLASYLCLCTEAPIRIGFAGPGSDLAYNYQVSPRDDRSGMDRYRVMARYIG